MPNLGTTELLIILFVILLLFGVGRVTNLGRELGNAVREFRKGLSGEEAKKEGEDKDTSGGAS
ncbi:MAG: twin-arginine translocase TatA/TatE family subunit [Chloroflexi bacterium]|nr:twin-arginine translocase TatA/TatE family subunit [Chloroflexota bacterium]